VIGHAGPDAFGIGEKIGEADAEEIRQRLQDPPGARMVQRLLPALAEEGWR
jgi:hypothetical protein